MTKTELKDFEELLDTAASGGTTITIIELIACLSVKQVLFANWILITSLQFYVYINDWNVLYPKDLQALMKEFRRITLGEFFDDF